MANGPGISPYLSDPSGSQITGGPPLPPLDPSTYKTLKEGGMSDVEIGRIQAQTAGIPQYYASSSAPAAPPPATNGTPSPAAQPQAANQPQPGAQWNPLPTSLTFSNPIDGQPQPIPGAAVPPSPPPQRPAPALDGTRQPLPVPEAQGTPMPGDPRGMIPTIRAAAIANGVDPDIAVRVAQSEGLATFLGDGGTSGGAFQLHVNGGEGDRFRQETGLDPLDPRNEKATIDWAMKRVRETGWEPWHGAAQIGITGGQGITGYTGSLTAGNTDYGKAAFAARQRGIDDIKETMRGLLKKMAETDPNDPEYKKLIQQHREFSQQLEQAYLDKAFHAPQRTQRDIMGQFGSLAMMAAVIGGFGARVPAIASLNAAGAAMNAMADNNDQEYKDKMEVWKLQTGVLKNAMDMENSQIKDILEEKRFSLAERHAALADAFSMLGMQEKLADLEAGNYEKLQKDQDSRVDMALKLGDLQKQHDEHEKAQLELQQERAWGGGFLGKQDEESALVRSELIKMAKEVTPNASREELIAAAQKLAQEDPNAIPTAVSRAHQDKSVAGKGQPHSVQVTWPDGKTEALTGWYGAPGSNQFTPVNGPTRDLTGAQVAPLTPAAASQQAMAAGVKPSTVEYWTRTLRAGGHLPSGLGRDPYGRALVRAIMDAMPEMAGDQTPEQFVATQSAVKANQASLVSMTRLADAATGFENVALANFDQALKLAPQVIPSDWGPWFNRWVETGATQFGDIETPAYVTALLTAANEYAKVINGSTGAQGSTVDSRREAATLFSPYLSAGQINAVVAVAKQDMENKKRENYAMVNDIRARIGKGSPEITAPPVATQPQGGAAKYSIGQIIERGGKRYRVTGGDLNADPEVEEVK